MPGIRVCLYALVWMDMCIGVMVVCHRHTVILYLWHSFEHIYNIVPHSPVPLAAIVASVGDVSEASGLHLC